MITDSKITEFFCIADDFCKIFNQKIQKYTFKANTKCNYHRDSILSIAEVMTIIVMFHSSGYKLNKEGTTIIMVTHSRHDAQYADRIINLFDGEIVNQVEI